MNEMMKKKNPEDYLLRDKNEEIKPDNTPESVRMRELLRPLTAEKLAALSMRFSGIGIVNFYKKQCLEKECRLLVPRPVHEGDGQGLAEVINRWNVNQHFFQCREIAEALEICKTVWEKHHVLH